MAEVTVNQLAETVGASVDRLLKQMKDAGLDHDSAEQLVSDDDKQKLLAYLKSSHGGSQGAAPKRITLKRKTLGTVKSASGSQGKKTVSVEVRKKRTYIKRDTAEPEVEEPIVEEALVDEELPVSNADSAPVVEEVTDSSVVEEQTDFVEADTSEDAAAVRRGDPFDAEELRQRAAAKRKEQERLDQERRETAKLRAEKERQEAAKKTQSEPSREAPAGQRFRDGESTTNTDDEPRKKNKSKKLAMKERGKGRGKHVRIDEYLQDEDQTFGGLRGGSRVLRHDNKHVFQPPAEVAAKEIALGEQITVADLAQQMAVKSNQVIKELMKLGVMSTINESIDQETASLVVEELGHKVKLVSSEALEEALEAELINLDGEQQSRPPVVTVMGHVDHGKTSLLDYIRKSRVASGEAGGITQHVGAYRVETDKGVVSFLDTPGHAAFTAMRARGAKLTDIVILVVAADDGVMPQTIEAVQHAKAAEVPIVVAVNKIDKEGADPERVKNELSTHEVIPEDWGGDTQFIHVSALTGEGIDELLDALVLQAELLELTARYEGPASGVVVESRLDKGRGNVASVLIQEGTLRNGDIVLAGTHFGRVRNMTGESGRLVEEAGPSIPVEILGLDGTPDAGDHMLVVKDERRAREVVAHRLQKDREAKFARQQKANLDNLFASFEADEVRRLSVIVKADVRGSAEAIVSALSEIGNEEVEVNIVSSGVGAIVEADVNLATATNAVVFGFNVRADATARKLAENESVEIRYYSVIYNLLDDVKDALSGMLPPEMREEIVGTAEVRNVFKSPKFGLVAGCMVVEGIVYRNKRLRVLRDNVVIHEGELDSLRRFKDDVAEVRSGTECGIGVKDYTDVREGDKIEVFDMHEVARSL